LLGELLLDRSNVKVMVRFVSEVQHLMMLMMLLKDSSRSTQFEAFHVFKVDGALHVHVHVHAVHLCGTS
jgi:calcium binding protein 39